MYHLAIFVGVILKTEDLTFFACTVILITSLLMICVIFC